MKNLEANLETGNRERFLELIDCFSTCAKIVLLQLLNGLRPVAEIIVIPKFRAKMIPSIDALKDLGFAVVEKDRWGIASYFISNDSGLLEDEALDSRDAKRFGELMGFPPTSIQAFINGGDNALLEGEELTKVIGFENHCFRLRFSKEMAEDEVRYLKESYRILLEQRPDLIDDMLPNGVDADEFKKKVSAFVYGRN